MTAFDLVHKFTTGNMGNNLSGCPTRKLKSKLLLTLGHKLDSNLGLWRDSPTNDLYSLSSHCITILVSFIKSCIYGGQV